MNGAFRVGCESLNFGSQTAKEKAGEDNRTTRRKAVHDATCNNFSGGYVLSLFREIGTVALEQGFYVVSHDVNFAVNVAGFARAEAAEAEIRVQATNNSLEELLIWFPGGGADPFLVRAEASNQTVAWHERT